MNNLKKIFFILVNQLDKLILGIMLALFVLSLFWLIETKNKSYEEITKSLSQSVKKSNYIPLDPASASTQSYFNKSHLWEKSIKRNKDTKSTDYIMAYSDFLIPFKIARSIADGANDKLIPYENYLAGICPITNKSLPKPDSEQLSLYTSSYDYDEDGIPDVMEKKYDLNPEFSDDAAYDADHDSFSNITEYKYDKKGVLDADIHPPLIKRIVLIRVANTKIPIVIKHILKTGYNKNNWKIQINIRQTNGRKTKFLKIGDNFTVNTIKYAIKNIKVEYEELLNPQMGIIESVDKTIIVLEDSLGQTINAILEEPVYEPNRRVLIKDLFTDKEIITKINNTISLGNKTMGIEKYKLISIGSNNRELTFEDEKTKTKYIVKKTSNYEKPLSK